MNDAVEGAANEARCAVCSSPRLRPMRSSAAQLVGKELGASFDEAPGHRCEAVGGEQLGWSHYVGCSWRWPRVASAQLPGGRF